MICWKNLRLSVVVFSVLASFIVPLHGSGDVFVQADTVKGTQNDPFSRAEVVDARHFVAPVDKRAVYSYPVATTQRSFDFEAAAKLNSPDENKINQHSVKSDQFPTILSASFYQTKTISLRNVVSPCEPETDGYFGATYGRPLFLHYKLEIQYFINALAELAFARTAIQNGITRSVITDTFPSICANRFETRRHRKMQSDHEKINDISRTGHSRTVSTSFSFVNKNATAWRLVGLKFDNDFQRLPEEPCKFLVSSSTTVDCAVYTSQISLYGNHLESGASKQVIQSIRSALSSILTQVSLYGIENITSIDSSFQTISRSERPSDVRNINSPQSDEKHEYRNDSRTSISHSDSLNDTRSDLDDKPTATPINNELSSSSTTSFSSQLSFGSKFGLGLLSVVVLVVVIVVLMYVHNDIQIRHLKMQEQQKHKDYGEVESYCDSDNVEFTSSHTFKHPQICTNTAKYNSTNTSESKWFCDPFSFIKRSSGRTYTVTTTCATSSTLIGDGESQCQQWIRREGRDTTTPQVPSFIPGQYCSNGIPIRLEADVKRNEKTMKSSVVVEFDPLFDPPSRRPDLTIAPSKKDCNDHRLDNCTEMLQSYDDEEENFYNDRNLYYYDHQSLTIDSDTVEDCDNDYGHFEYDDDSATCTSSIADLSNIDEQILISDRRRHIQEHQFQHQGACINSSRRIRRWSSSTHGSRSQRERHYSTKLR